MNSPVILTLFLGSSLLSGVAVFCSLHIAYRVNFLDAPDGKRKSQSTPIPKLGGIAVAVSFSLVVLTVLIATEQFRESSLAAGVLLPALGLAVVGFFDDKNNINPYIRLFFQIGFALVAWFLGTQFELTRVPIFDATLFVIWVMVIVNGVNLLDNSDGLAASTVFLSAIGASIIAGLFNQELVGLMAIALAGVAAGFLFYNWFPAQVYLGDSGAYFLGFMVAILAVRLRPEGVSSEAGIAIAFLLVVLPIMDTFYVVAKRLIQGIHPFTAGRDHMSHVLQENGHTVPGSVVLLQTISIAGAAGAVLIAFTSH